MEKPVKPVRLQFQHQGAGLYRAAARLSARLSVDSFKVRLETFSPCEMVLHPSYMFIKFPLYSLFPIKFSDWEPDGVTGPSTAPSVSRNL